MALGFRQLDEALLVLERASCRKTKIAAQPPTVAQTVQRVVVIESLGARFAAERRREIVLDLLARREIEFQLPLTERLDPVFFTPLQMALRTGLLQVLD